MRQRFAYDGSEGAPFAVPDDTTLLRSPPPPARGPTSHLDDAMRQPIEAERLSEVAADARRVLLLVDDATRTTPVAAMLAPVARELEAADVEGDRVEVLVAPGTHRRMTPAEMQQKLGRFHDRWRVRQHDWQDQSRLVLVGETTAGMPVVVNRSLTEADLVVGLGHVGVHAIMGFSGGAKIVLPGVAGAASGAWTHWSATRYAREDLLGVVGNPLRSAIEAGAQIAGLDFVFNVTMDREGRVQAAAYGAPVAVQRRLAAVSHRLHAAPLAEPVDIVVTDSRPADRDLWQSAKGLYCATVAVREGGIIICASPNHEGVARDHPDLLRLAGLSADELERRVELGRERDVMAAAVAHYLARIRQRSDVFLVSGGITAEEARTMGFASLPSVQDAVDAARARLGPDASIAVMDGAGALLPVVGGRNRSAVGTPGVVDVPEVR